MAAPRPHRQQLSGLDAAHLESTAMAVTVTDSEHKDGDGGGDCEDVRMEGALWGIVPFVAGGGGG